MHGNRRHEERELYRRLRGGAVGSRCNDGRTRGGGTGLDGGDQNLSCGGRLRRIVEAEPFLQILVYAQGADDISARDPLVHKSAAGLFVRGIEIEDRKRDPCLIWSARLGFSKGLLQGAQQPVAIRLPFRQHPATERRIDMLESTQQIVGQPLPLQQERVNIARCRRVQDRQRINVNGFRPEPNVMRARAQTPIPAELQAVAQITDSLTESSSRMRLVRLAPQQGGEAVAVLAKLSVQCHATQNCAYFRAADGNGLIAEPNSQVAEQRNV